MFKSWLIQLFRSGTSWSTLSPSKSLSDYAKATAKISLPNLRASISVWRCPCGAILGVKLRCRTAELLPKQSFHHDVMQYNGPDRLQKDRRGSKTRSKDAEVWHWGRDTFGICNLNNARSVSKMRLDTTQHKERNYWTIVLKVWDKLLKCFFL